MATTQQVKKNPYLSAEKYATTHFDPAQSDTIPYPAPKGEFHVDLRKEPRVAGGPTGLMQFASTSPQYMWGISSGAISYIDTSNGGWKQVAQIAVPDSTNVPISKLDAVLSEQFTTVEQVEKAVKQELGLDWKRISNNVYGFVDKDNVFYGNTSGGKIHAYGLIDPSNPSKGIKILRTLDFNNSLKKIAAGGSAAMQKYGAFIVGCNLTYDGQLLILSNRSISVIDRDFKGPEQTLEFGPDEYISNSMAVDEKGGIYIASDTTMYKVVWNGKKLSKDEKDGAWSSPYEFGEEPPSVKFGRGTGSTPTLMGFGNDPDKLVVITDGANRMNIVAFWRDEIPADFQQKAGTKSRRIADQMPITCGLSPLPKFIQSEQSVVVNGYGAFVVNNIRPEGNPDKLVDVVAGGPVFAPPAGVERVEWDPETHTWHSVWTRSDVVGTSMVPAVSAPSNIVFINGYTKKDGWELTGLDWNTGKTVHRTIFGHDNLGNGAYALIQFLENGDLLFNSIGGSTRVHLQMNDPSLHP